MEVSGSRDQQPNCLPCDESEEATEDEEWFGMERVLVVEAFLAEEGGSRSDVVSVKLGCR